PQLALGCIKNGIKISPDFFTEMSGRHLLIFTLSGFFKLLDMYSEIHDEVEDNYLPIPSDSSLSHITMCSENFNILNTIKNALTTSGVNKNKHKFYRFRTLVSTLLIT